MIPAMTAKGYMCEALDGAFRAAWFFSGCTEAAENAVLEGIAALDGVYIGDDLLLVETVKSAIRSSSQTPSHLPSELRRLLSLAPISYDFFVLRVLLGITSETCAAILHLTAEEGEEVLCAALRELPPLEGRGKRVR